MNGTIENYIIGVTINRFEDNESIILRFIRLHEQLNNIQEMILALEEPTIDGTNRNPNNSTGRGNKHPTMQ